MPLSRQNTGRVGQRTLFEEASDLLGKHMRSGRLAHDINAGNACFVCGENCPGFELHFWRKACRHCKCSPHAHDTLLEDDDDDYVSMSAPRKVGRLSEDLRRTFLTDESGPTGEARKGGRRQSRGKGAKKADASAAAAGGSTAEEGKLGTLEVPPLTEETDFVWAPEGLTQKEILKFFEAPYPLQDVPVVDTDGERRFAMAVERQLPTHDLNIELCDDLTALERSEFEALLQLKEQCHEIGKARVAALDTNCSYCMQPFQQGKLQVYLESLPMARYHPACFRCTTCKELLAGLQVFIKDGGIYCERHFSDLYKARCFACDESICEAQFLQAEGRPWHMKHFCCYECDKPLKGDPYVPRDNHPHCMPCFDAIMASDTNAPARPARAPQPAPPQAAGDANAPPKLPPRRAAPPPPAESAPQRPPRPR